MAVRNTDQKKTSTEKVAGFINNNKKALWFALGSLIVLIAVFAILQGSINKRNQYYSNTAEKLQTDFNNWANASKDKKDSLEKVFLDEVEGFAGAEKGNYLVDKALFLRGQLHLQKEEWGPAFDDFNKVAEISPDSYLASVCLYNAAAAKESSGDQKAALDILKSLSLKYRKTSPLIPETLFSIGRLNEALGNNDDAVAAYNDLASSYSTSNWTNLAKTRIISLKASGVSK